MCEAGGRSLGKDWNNQTRFGMFSDNLSIMGGLQDNNMTRLGGVQISSKHFGEE